MEQQDHLAITILDEIIVMLSHSDNTSTLNNWAMSVEETTNKSSKQIPSTLSDCSTNDLWLLLKYEMKHEKVKPYKKDILAFIEKKKINGRNLKQMQRRSERCAFGETLITYYGSKKIRCAALKTYDFFIKYKFNPMKQKYTDNDVINEICTYTQFELQKLLVINDVYDNKQTIYKSSNELFTEYTCCSIYQTCESTKRIKVILNAYKQLTQSNLCEKISFVEIFTYKDIYTLQQIKNDFEHIQSHFDDEKSDLKNTDIYDLCSQNKGDNAIHRTLQQIYLYWMCVTKTKETDIIDSSKETFDAKKMHRKQFKDIISCLNSLIDDDIKIQSLWNEKKK
eukprot:522883_1